MNIFKKLDKIFFHSFITRLENQRYFLMSLEKKNLTVGQGILVLEKLIAEEKKCNIII